MKLFLAFACAALTFAQNAPRVVYTKTFPGSTPAYVSITIDRGGAVSYKEDPKDDDPEKLQIEPATTSIIFDLADKLDHFKRPVESGLKVANMGAKTFRYEDGSAATEAKFNYSTDLNAQALQGWFETITDSERAFLALRLTIKHDKLGVHQSLMNIETLWTQNRLVGIAQFLPLFDRVAGDETYLNIARERAKMLAEAVRKKDKAE
ncbi:MAG TPA: hypothetical protein VGN17_16525 [Bryobacteraceae bacterium]